MEFKDSLLMSPPIVYGGGGGLDHYRGGGVDNPSLLHPIPAPDLHSLAALVHIQLGQIVRNSAVCVILVNCPKLKQLHCNRCPDLR